MENEFKFHAYETVTPNKTEQKDIAERAVLEQKIEDRELLLIEILEFDELINYQYNV